MGEEERVGRVENGTVERVEGSDSGGVVAPLPGTFCYGRGGDGIAAVRGGGGGGGLGERGGEENG